MCQVSSSNSEWTSKLSYDILLLGWFVFLTLLHLKMRIKNSVVQFVQLAKDSLYDVLRTLPDPEPTDESIIPSDSLEPNTVLRFFHDDQEAIDYNAYDSTAAECQEQPLDSTDPM